MATFSSLQKENIEAICAIEQECFGTRSKDRYEKSLTSEINDYFVAKQDDKIVGFVGIMHIDYECEILTVAVSGDVRKQGIGSFMLTELLKIVKNMGVTNLYLEVNEFNLPAIGLYKKFGFEQSYIRKNYYGTNSALILKKDIL